MSMHKRLLDNAAQQTLGGSQPTAAFCSPITYNEHEISLCWERLWCLLDYRPFRATQNNRKNSDGAVVPFERVRMFLDLELARPFRYVFGCI